MTLRIEEYQGNPARTGSESVRVRDIGDSGLGLTRPIPRDESMDQIHGVPTTPKSGDQRSRMMREWPKMARRGESRAGQSVIRNHSGCTKNSRINKSWGGM